MNEVQTLICAERDLEEAIIESSRWWDAFAAHGDTCALRLKYAKKVSDIIGEEIKPHRKINSTMKAKQMRRLKQERNTRKKRGDGRLPAEQLRTKTASVGVPP